MLWKAKNSSLKKRPPGGKASKILEPFSFYVVSRLKFCIIELLSFNTVSIRLKDTLSTRQQLPLEKEAHSMNGIYVYICVCDGGK